MTKLPFHINDAAWRFDTHNFSVCFFATPEDIPPEDAFCFDEDIEAVRNGDVEYFNAWLVVYDQRGNVIEYDTLGACAYKSLREFYTEHRDRNPLNRNSSIMRKARGENVVICHYFPDMVKEAVSRARAELCRVKSIPLRCEAV